MEQHAVPRQITSFEFKLIGFFTLKQFGYLVIFAGAAVLIYFLTPVAILNIIVAGSVFGLGVAFVMVKYNERSLDVWLKNLFVRLFSASQYKYHKRNTPPAFLYDVFANADQTIAETHLDARQKLANYTRPTTTLSSQKQDIHNLIHTSPTQQLTVNNAHLSETASTVANGLASNRPTDLPTPSSKTPVLVGVVKNNKETPLPNIMLYVKDSAGKTVRILKTNSHGVFASFHSLKTGSYSIEPKDLGSRYFFDTMNVPIPQTSSTPLAIYSKEII